MLNANNRGYHDLPAEHFSFPRPRHTVCFVCDFASVSVIGLFLHCAHLLSVLHCLFVPIYKDESCNICIFVLLCPSFHFHNPKHFLFPCFPGFYPCLFLSDYGLYVIISAYYFFFTRFSSCPTIVLFSHWIHPFIISSLITLSIYTLLCCESYNAFVSVIPNLDLHNPRSWFSCMSLSLMLITDYPGLTLHASALTPIMDLDYDVWVQPNKTLTKLCVRRIFCPGIYTISTQAVKRSCSPYFKLTN